MAMMSWMRRSSRYFLAVVVITFIGSLAYFGATQDRSGQTTVATVNGEGIQATEFDRARRAAIEQYRQMLKERFSEDLLKSLRVQEQVLDRLVTERLTRQRAAAEGIGVSDEELGAEITRIAAFQQDGRFSRDQYVRTLGRVGLTPAAFEADMRTQLLQKKLQAVITDGVKVSEAEVRQSWEARRDRVRAAYLFVPTESYLGGAEPSDAELEAHYKAHPNDYTRPERRRVLMALLPTASVPPPAVSDADVEAAYNERRSQYEQPERRRVAHILVRVPTVGGSAAEDKARAKAEAALERIKGGADFGQVAREVSEDAATASRGGDLGAMARGELVAPFEAVAFNLKLGELGGPVRTGFGFHVIKLLEIIPGSRQELAAVAGPLRANLAAEGQLRLLRGKADDVHQALLRAPDFAAAARERGLSVREIGPLGRNDPVEGVGRVPDATNAIFALPNAGVSAPVKVPEGYAIFRLLETEASRLQPLAEVRSQVVLTVRREKAQAAAQAKARQLVDGLRAGQDPKALARQDGITAGETSAFSRGEPLPDRELAAAIGTIALELPEGGVGGPAGGGRGFYAVKVVAREHPDPTEFEKARPELEKQLLEQKRTRAWQAWLAALRANAKVEINRKVLPES